MISKIIFGVAVIITISGCLIYSERLYVREFKLKGLFWLIIGFLYMAVIGKFIVQPYLIMCICGVLPLGYCICDIVRNYHVPHYKIPRYNWCALFIGGMVAIGVYWMLGGDLITLH